MKMNLIQEIIHEEILISDIRRILDGIDADYTGLSGVDYYREDGISQFDYDLKTIMEIEYGQEKIEYMLDGCKEYSSNYYKDFKYTIVPMSENSWLITIATMD